VPTEPHIFNDRNGARDAIKAGMVNCR
jgi:hypothetical protein